MKTIEVILGLVGAFIILSVMLVGITKLFSLIFFGHEINLQSLFRLPKREPKDYYLPINLDKIFKEQYSNPKWRKANAIPFDASIKLKMIKAINSFMFGSMSTIGSTEDGRGFVNVYSRFGNSMLSFFVDDYKSADQFIKKIIEIKYEIGIRPDERIIENYDRTKNI